MRASAVDPARETVNMPLVGPAFEALGCVATMLNVGGGIFVFAMNTVALRGAPRLIPAGGPMATVTVSVGRLRVSGMGVTITLAEAAPAPRVTLPGSVM